MTQTSKILIIDDDNYICESIVSSLRIPQFDISFSVAHNATDGLRQVKWESPDLIILDLGLPDASGFEVLEAIREDTQIDVRVIMLTANDTRLNLWEGFDKGLDDFIGKPFDLEELEARVYNQMISKTTWKRE